jgi:large conductance mechanosensitive channel
MGLIKEFKEFSVKGNAIDLAVGVIIGTAFGKIVSSIVNDIIMPPIGLLVGGVDFKALKVVMQNPVSDATGKIIKEAVTLNYGNFLQTTFDFLIIAFCIFMLVKALNTFKKKEEEKPPEPKEEVILLKEIRDALTKK